MSHGSRLLSLLLLACGLSSTPLGSMEQTCEPGQTTISVPRATSLRAATIASARPAEDDRSARAELDGCAARGPIVRWPPSFPPASVESAPRHRGIELADLLGFRATAPPSRS